MHTVPPPAQIPSSRLLATLSADATQAGVELFRAYGIELRSNLSHMTLDKAGDLAFLSIAGFSGPSFSGFIGMGATEDVLRRSNLTTSSSYDWMAELANQFVGRIKNLLLRQGIVIHRTPPAVVEGYAPTLFYPLTDFKSVSLLDQHESVFIWMKFEPSLDGPDMSPASYGEVLAEGELLLF